MKKLFLLMLLALMVNIFANAEVVQLDNDVGIITVDETSFENFVAAPVYSLQIVPEVTIIGDSFSLTILSETDLSYAEMAVENGIYIYSNRNEFSNTMYIPLAINDVKESTKLNTTIKKNIHLFAWKDPGWQEQNKT